MCVRARVSRWDWEAALIGRTLTYWIKEEREEGKKKSQQTLERFFYCSDFVPVPVINPNKDSSRGRRKPPRAIRFTHLLLQTLTPSPCRDFIHIPPPSFAFRRNAVAKISLRFGYQTSGSLLLLSPALHSLCALRIHDAKVRSANGFNGAPTIESSLPARY